MPEISLSWLSAASGIISAGFWFYSAISISRESELQRRKKQAKSKGKQLDQSGVVIVDDNHRYDLIATLRHQARWSKWGACFAAIALLLQAADNYFE